MRLVSWNVNGLRACLGKGFEEFFRIINADIVALQETKLQPHQIELELEGYEQYWHSAVKKGYSGTAELSKLEPFSSSSPISFFVSASEPIQVQSCFTLSIPFHSSALFNYSFVSSIPTSNHSRYYLLQWKFPLLTTSGRR